MSFAEQFTFQISGPLRQQREERQHRVGLHRLRRGHPMGILKMKIRKRERKEGKKPERVFFCITKNLFEILSQPDGVRSCPFS
jgi:hypothetical protein